MHRSVGLLITGSILGIAALGALHAHRKAAAAATHVPPPARPVASVTDPRVLSDPLVPNRPMQLDEAKRAATPAWVSARPGFQSSKSASERGGVEPCATQAVDASSFEDWHMLGPGKLTWPRDGALDGSGQFDLIIHFHGDEPVRRELILSGQKLVLYAITLGPNQGYGSLLNSAAALSDMKQRVEESLGKRLGRDARVRHVALSAWSAGFTGVAAALAQPEAEIEAVVLIDGLHAPRGDRAAFEAQLAPFVRYAKRAASEQSLFLVTHSSIDPPGFASTTECAHYLISQLEGVPQAVHRQDALGLDLVESFQRGAFHVRGYAGNDKADHCAQLGILRDAYSALGRRWAPK